MNRKGIIISALVVLIGVIIFLFFRSTPIKNLPAKNSTIVAFGDSLVAGVGSSESRDFISVLSFETNTQIINMGVSGNTTAEGLARVDEVIAQNPGIVILLLGGNDYLRRIEPEKTFENLSTIIDRLHREGIAVLLLGVRGGLLTDHFNDDFKKLAKQKEVGFVPNILDGLVTHPEFMSDAVHPNNIGYAKIAKKVLPVLQKMIAEK